MRPWPGWQARSRRSRVGWAPALRATKPCGRPLTATASSGPASATAGASSPRSARPTDKGSWRRFRVRTDRPIHGTNALARRSDMATNDPFGDFRRRPGSLFDEFFSEFFDRPLGIEGATSPTGRRTSAPTARRPVEQVDITQFFSDATRELLQRAAQLALDWGSLDLDTEHLLWAAMQDDLVAQIVRHANGDPAAIAAQVEDETERGGRTDVAPTLSPEAKAALLRAYDEMRELNSSYLGPEHVLLALARDAESDAGRLLARFGLSH